MIVDLTKQFHRLANIPPAHQTSYAKSEFLDYSSRVLQQLCTVHNRLQSLSLLIKKSGTLNKQQGTINKQFINIKELLREVEKKVKKCVSINSDVKTDRDLKQKFKEQVNIVLECKFIACSLSYKKQYETKVLLQNTLAAKKLDIEDDQHRISKSTFLQQSKSEILERQRVQEYQQIQQGLAHITETYKSMVSMVKMQELMVEQIGDNTDVAYDNIVEGRRNLSQVNEKEKKNRQFIIKVFLILYVFVFIYINILL